MSLARLDCRKSLVVAFAAALLAGCVTADRGRLGLAEDQPLAQPTEPGTRLIPTLYTPYPLESGAISVFSAMCEGPNGEVYSGSCCYDDWAKVFRQRPGADTLDTVLNVGALAGQLHYPTEHHSKIHTQLTLGTDGWIYGGSKRGNEFFDERALYGASEFQYPGGIFFRYHPKTGMAQNLGVPRPGEGLISMAYDASRHRFWVLSDPRTELLRIDVQGDTIRTLNLGQVSRYPARHFATDPAGNVWIVSREGVLLRVDAETHAMREYRVAGLEPPLTGGYFHFEIPAPGNRILMMAGGSSRLIQVHLTPDGDQLRAEVLCDFARLHPKLHSVSYTAIDPVTRRMFVFFADGPWRTGRSVHLASAHLDTGAMQYHGQLAVVNGEGFDPSAVWAAVVTQSREIVFGGACLVNGVHSYGSKHGAGVFRIGPIERLLAASPERELSPPPEPAKATPRPSPEPKFAVLTLDDRVPVGERAVTGLAWHDSALAAVCVGRDVVRLLRAEPDSGTVSELWRAPLDPAFAPYSVDLLPTPTAGRYLLAVRRVKIDITAAMAEVNGWNLEAVQDETGAWKARHRQPPGLTTFFGYSGGRLFLADLASDSATMTDLGIPVPGEDLTGTTVLNNALDLVAYTSWTGDLVHVTGTADAASREVQPARVPATRKGQPDQPVTGLLTFDPLQRRHVPNATLKLADGQVLATGASGHFFLYNPSAKALRQLDAALPELPGRVEFATLGGAVQLANGRVVGLTNAGRLFELDLAAGTVLDLGKPLRQNGAKALILNPVDGRLYGAGGEPFGIDRLFAWDPASRAFTQLGILTNPREICRFGRVGSLAVLPDGRLAVGELDNLADIEIWPAAK